MLLGSKHSSPKKMSFFKLQRKRPRQQRKTHITQKGRIKRPRQEHNKSKKKELFQAPEAKATPRQKATPRAQQVSKKGAFSSSIDKGHAKTKRPREEHNKSKKKEQFQAPERKATPRAKGHAKSERPR